MDVSLKLRYTTSENVSKLRNAKLVISRYTKYKHKFLSIFFYKSELFFKEKV